MKSILLLFALSLGWNSTYAHSEESNPLITPEHFLEMASIIKTETTQKEWSLFCGITQQPNDYYFLEETKVLSLSWDEALHLTAWLVDNQKDQRYLAQILQEIDECPAPTEEKLKKLCMAIRYPETDHSETSIGQNYHRELWSLACAVPKVDSTAVGRAKVKAYWEKHKTEIRCPITELNFAEDLSITKYAVDALNTRFTAELAVAYKLNLNFVDEKDGMTILDYIQAKINSIKNQVPVPERLLQDHETVYNHVKRSGGKHAKDL